MTKHKKRSAAMRPLAYEGPENYAFISYAHKDSKKVMPIAKYIASRGYRIWYDDGVAPASEWPENIALHLYKSALFIAFITDNYVASSNCRREFTFALQKNRPFLGVILEKTDLPLGVEMQLSAQQCIMRDNFSDEGEFLKRILTCPEFAFCKMSEHEAASAQGGAGSADTAERYSTDDFRIEGRKLIRYRGKDENVIVPDCVLSLGKGVFTGKLVKSVIVSDGVTEIEEAAFSLCPCLETVKLPKSLNSLGAAAFFSCGVLKTVDYDGTVEEWNAMMKGKGWDSLTGDYKVLCSDGAVKKGKRLWQKWIE